MDRVDGKSVNANNKGMLREGLDNAIQNGFEVG
jgi:hypothetical protein